MADRVADPQKARAEIRADFIKRLFAVAISVGFATTLARMTWVEKGRWPELGEREQIFVLIVSLIATVLSWDSYLLSIMYKPHRKPGRFVIDIVLVFVYMFLLITSKHPSIWMFNLTAIFTLYVIWDVLTVREHISQFDAGITRNDSASVKISEVLRVYARGAIDDNAIDRGPINTFVWAMYFGTLAVLFLLFRKDHMFVTGVFVLAGLVAYRIERDCRMKHRFLIYFGLLLSAFVYYAVF